MNETTDLYIIAVVVTYNRLPLLKKCLKSILKQTRVPDEIIIVNNSSTDGTKEYLATLTGNITIIEQENSGASGGFYTGMKAACERNADWIWTVDDDVVFSTPCLETLLKYRTISHCIHPFKHYPDDEPFIWEPFFDVDTCNVVSQNNFSYKNNKELFYTNLACFEGMLIKSSIVKKVGFPDKRFFIVNDDTVYGMLVNQYTNITCIMSAIAYRYGSGNTIETDAYLYYYIRNRHLVEEYTDKLFPGTSKKVRKIVYYTYVLKKLITIPPKRDRFTKKVKSFMVISRAFFDYKKKLTGKTF